MASSRKSGRKRSVAIKLAKRRSASRAPLLAAVDLGSNSFHLVVAEVRNGAPVVVDRLREMLRFGSGLDVHGHIRPEAAKRVLACLKRFGQRLALWEPQLVRAVGTSTLRQATNTANLLLKAQARLGAPIEVISGIEEARLIYSGVSADVGMHERALIIDIGGGSTEIIVGTGRTPQVLESVTMGCVTMTDRALRGRLLTGARFAQVVELARRQLRPILAEVTARPWQRVIGSSGTIRAIENVVRELGLRPQGLTLAVLHELASRLTPQRRIAPLVLPGLATERAPVFAGGLAILIAAFEVLGIEEMEVSRGALREGILRDLIERWAGRDVREAAVERFAQRWQTVHGPQAVSRLAVLTEGAASGWHLSDHDRQFVAWAARLHDCGLAVARTDFPRHSAYIVRHAELAGFSSREQEFLATLITLTRGRWSGATLRRLPALFGPAAVRLAILLRLATALASLDEGGSLPMVRTSAKGATLKIHVVTRRRALRDSFAAHLATDLADMHKSGVRFVLT